MANCCCTGACLSGGGCGAVVGSVKTWGSFSKKDSSEENTFVAYVKYLKEEYAKKAGPQSDVYYTDLPPVSFKVKKIHPDAKIPTKANPTDSGWDLYSVEDLVIDAGETKLISCGIAIDLPPGWEGVIRGRSSLSKQGISCQLGTVDSGYQNVWKVCLSNVGKCFYPVMKGDRIAQVVFQRVEPTQLIETTEDFAPTDRGMGGFGSSGK